MWETPSYSPSAIEVSHEALKLQSQNHLQEIERLRALLATYNIDSTKPDPPSASISTRKKTRQSTLIPWTRKLASIFDNKPLPHLPNEITLRILSIVVTHSYPVIDPFWKLRPENLTRKELKQASLNLNFLATCRAFKVEGTRLLVANNSFIFTQLEALQNFSNISSEFRTIINDVNLRIVGKYYDTYGVKRTLYGEGEYHEEHDAPTVWVSPRPAGSGRDKGIQGYCWQQVMDFLRALVIQPIKGKRSHLFPGLKNMRIDMVNFCEHLPFIGSTLISVVRWHIGHIVDELTITGVVENASNGEELYLEYLVREGGLVRLSPPTFVSIVHSKDRQNLRTLPCDKLMLKVVRPKMNTLAKRKKQTHPEGGDAPESIHPPGVTTWKYVSESLTNRNKKWIEFHLGCGMAADECGELRGSSSDEEEDDDDNDDEHGWEDAEDDAEGINSEID